jgi:hypothetical protein
LYFDGLTDHNPAASHAKENMCDAISRFLGKSKSDRTPNRAEAPEWLEFMNPPNGIKGKLTPVSTIRRRDLPIESGGSAD